MFDSTDFSSYLDSALLADVEVSIIVHVAAEPASREHYSAVVEAPITTPRSHPSTGRAVAVLPGHRLVLHAASPLFAQHIERWERGLRAPASAAGAAIMPGPAETPRPVRAKIQLLVNNDADAEAAQVRACVRLCVCACACVCVCVCVCRVGDARMCSMPGGQGCRICQ